MVLPSAGDGLVNTMIGHSLPLCQANKTEASAARNDSASIEGRRCQVTSSTRSGSVESILLLGMRLGVRERPTRVTASTLAEGITPSSSRFKYCDASPGV